LFASLHLGRQNGSFARALSTICVQMTIPDRYRPALLAALVALALYAITLKGTYIEDDVVVIHEDPRLSEPGQWHRLLTEEYWLDGSVDHLYRPLVSLSFALQRHLTGDNPTWFHTGNWLLNAIVAAMVAEFARRLAGSDSGNGPAYIAGLLFAVHPIHVEVIAGIVGRAEMMCAIGILGALMLLLHRPITHARALAVVGCLAIAIFSKEQGMFLPLLMLLMPLSLGVDGPKSERERRAVMWLVVMVCWFTASYVVFREYKFKFEWDTYFLDFSQQPLVRSFGRNRILMPLVLLGHYAKLLIFPIRLSPDYGGQVLGWIVRADDPYLYAGIAVVIVYVVAVATLIHRRRSSRRASTALFCLLAAGVLYGMVGNIISLIGTNFGERLMYLPSAFLAIAAGIGLMRLPKALVVVIMTIAIVLGSVRTMTYASRWNDRLRFYEESSADQPKSVRLDMLVTVESLSQGKLDEAEEADRKGREALPDYTQVWIQSAQIALARGRFDEANAYLDQAMKIQPSIQVESWRRKVAAARHAAAAK
jgi:hypothetical protein